MAVAGQRAAVVAMAEGEWMRVYIAYPPGTSAEQVQQDLAAVCDVGKLESRDLQLKPSEASTVAVCYLRPKPDTGKRSIPIWPFVYALRRFDELAIAYIGRGRPAEGKVENDFVEVRWKASAAGINYFVRVKRRDFAGLSELTAGFGGQSVGVARPARGGNTLAALALVVLLALAAAAVTYWGARKILGVPSAQAPPGA